MRRKTHRAVARSGGGGAVTKVSPYWYLGLGLIWLGLAVDRTAFHSSDRDVAYLSIALAVGFLGQFAWTKWKRS
jgi:hypothetical protein